MQGHLYLEFAGSVLTFSLRAAVACLVCICFTRLLRNPQHRFLVWLLFLAGSGLYWLRLIGAVGALVVRPSAALAASSHGMVPARDHFYLPETWMAGLGRLDAAALAMYLAGLLWLTGRQVWRSLRLRALVRLASKPSPGLSRMLDRMCHDFGVVRCELLVLPELISPATVYWRKPRILLPESCHQQAATPRIMNVFRHELVHIARRDYLVSAISDAFCALLFFHPAAWFARKQMRLERELACDLAAVSDCPEQRANYADTLAHFVRLHMLGQQSAARGMDFAGSVSFLSRRIHCILEEPQRTPWWKKFSAATVGLALWTVFAFSAPGLAVVLDFSGKPASPVKMAANRAPVRSALLRRLKSIAKVRFSRTQAGAMGDPVLLPDTLTSLRVHDRVTDTDGPTLTAPGNAGDDIAETPEDDISTWNEQSPASPRYSGPSARSILVAAIGGIAASEQREHAGRGRER